MIGRTHIAYLAILAAVLGLVATPALGTDPALFQFAGEVHSAEIGTIREDGVTYFRLSDLARVFQGVRHWNPRTGKMTLTVGAHRISMTDGGRFVAFDQGVENLERPARMRNGVFWVSPGFVTRVLARAANADISWEPAEGVLAVTELGPVVRSASLEDRPDGTIVSLGLSGLADFTAESASRGAIEVFIPGARLLDSLAVEEGAGFVQSVDVEQTEEGVRTAIGVTERASRFGAGIYYDPYRIEVRVEGGDEATQPSPPLRAAKLPSPREAGILGHDEGVIETVMIDPGHGGRDAGAVGPAGLLEKDAALALSRELSRALQNEDFYVFMTRSSDSFVPPKRRAEIANLALADVFVSVQCDAWYSREARGYRVSYFEPHLAPSGSAARSRGRGLARIGTESPANAPSELVWDRMQEGSIAESRLLARYVHESMSQSLSLWDRGLRREHFTVLAGCAMPAVLIEMGFITSASDEGLFADRDFLRKVAQSIAQGIVEYRNDVRRRSQ